MTCECNRHLKHFRCSGAVVPATFPHCSDPGCRLKWYPHLDPRLIRRRKTIINLLETFYEKCAGYNLRYCPLQGFASHRSIIHIALQDLFVLCCFIIANFVIFVTLMIRTLLHVSSIFIFFMIWVYRSCTKSIYYACDSRPLKLPHCQDESAVKLQNL